MVNKVITTTVLELKLIGVIQKITHDDLVVFLLYCGNGKLSQ
jgi:hypothetical protein